MENLKQTSSKAPDHTELPATIMYVAGTCILGGLAVFSEHIQNNIEIYFYIRALSTQEIATFMMTQLGDLTYPLAAGMALQAAVSTVVLLSKDDPEAEKLQQFPAFSIMASIVSLQFIMNELITMIPGSTDVECVRSNCPSPGEWSDIALFAVPLYLLVIKLLHRYGFYNNTDDIAASATPTQNTNDG